MIWVDAQLSPALALWISDDLGHPARSVRDLGLREAKTRRFSPPPVWQRRSF